MKPESFFFAQPIDIFDALFSSEKKYSLKQLKLFALERGIVVSSECDRETLCRRLASLTYDFHLFSMLSASMQSVSRQKQSSVIHLDKEISISDIQKILPKLQQKRNREDISIKANSGVTKIDVSYTEINHGQTRLKQRTPRDSSIEVMKGKIRYTSDERTDEVLSTLISCLEDEKNGEIKLKKIDLSSIIDPRIINKLFLDLTLCNNEELPFMQVSHVGIHKIESNTDDQNASENLMSNINNASLSGSNVLNSPEVKNFLKSGEYYIHAIRWLTDPIEITNSRGEKQEVHLRLGALVSPPETRETFKFEPVRYHLNIEGNMSVQDRPLDKINEKPFLDKLETYAFELYEKAINK